MSNVSGTMEPEAVVGKQALVRRMFNMVKDDNYSGPPAPLLSRHASMQKIRHCCQNLNLLPYLLYSFDNSKSHPIARKVHLCFDQLLQVVTARLLCLYEQFRQTLLQEIQTSKELRTSQEPEGPRSELDACRLAVKFDSIPRRKRKQTPLYLTLAVYLAPLLLFLQLVGLLGLMEIAKCTPGFMFLTSALLFLGCISLKVFFHETVPRPARRQKNKVL
nr:uncharacterized protein LOC117226469 [Megalopta genalis]XP_033336695.1 uncharacterized protein LOC117226469 [Megalopta genalis]XP_033336696.1 uncharacterized protein LOC117226469 [Megalopta genalis]XP_033336697.1 uncharacterized protein LOC117226469 [Megalopta genalis]XP_033336698.1 uncharacterized protein LOC117226469 [Megalopta genalis]XP_033336699.1 uncharacterized protein LOC117226469 [Megalopta genalis]XP_033336700.1 uncharacterized protein LOC117226469 [Megalopta genalis]